MDDDGESNRPKESSGGYAFALCFILLWLIIILSTLLSVGCTWGYAKHYDDSPTAFSIWAAILTTIALCGCTLGFCSCGGVGKGTKAGMGFLWACYNEMDCDHEIAYCCKFLALCGLGIIIVPSFGILQLISGSLMVKSLVINTAMNVKVFAGFIAAFDYLAAFAGLFFASCFCAACSDEC